MSNNIGAVYGVSGLPWMRELFTSSASLRRAMPELPQELFIDIETQGLLSEKIKLSTFFDYITVYEPHDHWRSAKFAALHSRRFEKSLFLDCDTYITDRLDELFELLDRFDIASLPAPQRIHRKAISTGLVELFPSVPVSFTEYNTGVIPFRRKEEFFNMVMHWQSLFKLGVREKGYRMDQASFRSATYHSDLRICPLIPEYNFRAGAPNVVKDKVKIVHAHGHLKAIAEIVNRKSGNHRIWTPRPELLYGFMPKGVTGKGETTIENQDDLIADIVLMIDADNGVGPPQNGHF